MKSEVKKRLGERELDIMQSLWRLEKATVAQVQEDLRKQDSDIAYTTIQTMLNRLETKKLVARDDSERTHRYYALLAEPDVAGSALRRLVERFFRGSTEALVTRLLEEDLTSEQLGRIQSLIDKHRKEE
ncbi:MAG TPA: BlaI/MecI/CopY family transcriptional regulator [Pyrinomonadaceae bacterium]|jgi:predicted transcriptional regulator